MSENELDILRLAETDVNYFKKDDAIAVVKEAIASDPTPELREKLMELDALYKRVKLVCMAVNEAAQDLDIQSKICGFGDISVFASITASTMIAVLRDGFGRKPLPIIDRIYSAASFDKKSEWNSVVYSNFIKIPPLRNFNVFVLPTERRPRPADDTTLSKVNAIIQWFQCALDAVELEVKMAEGALLLYTDPSGRISINHFIWIMANLQFAMEFLLQTNHHSVFAGILKDSSAYGDFDEIARAFDQKVEEEE